MHSAFLASIGPFGNMELLVIAVLFSILAIPVALVVFFVTRSRKKYVHLPPLRPQSPPQPPPPLPKTPES